jgi:hypothetical protein
MTAEHLFYHTVEILLSKKHTRQPANHGYAVDAVFLLPGETYATFMLVRKCDPPFPYGVSAI